MAILPLALKTGCNGTAPNDEQQAERQTERNGPPASVGPITTQSFDLTGFSGVEVAGPDDVTVRRGDSFSIVARGRQETLDRLEIKVDGRSEEHTSELQSLMRISYAVFCLKK